jgi:hypothetical protein
LEASSGVPAAAAVCPVVEDEEDEVEDDDAVAAERVVASGSSSTLFSSAEVEPGTSPIVLSEGGETNGIGGRRPRGKQGTAEIIWAWEMEKCKNIPQTSTQWEERRGTSCRGRILQITTLTRITCNMEKEHLPEGVGREPRADGTAAAVGGAAGTERVVEDAEVDEDDDEETSTPESGERGVPAPPEELEFVEAGAKAADDSGRPAAPEEFELGYAAESRGWTSASCLTYFSGRYSWSTEKHL